MRMMSVLQIGEALIVVRQRLLCWLKRDDGSGILETAILLPVLILMLIGAVDFGRAFYLAIEVGSAAHAGALYGSQYPTDTAGMKTAATLDAADVSGLTPTATYGCECADGSGAVASCTTAPSCTYNVVYYVQVNTTATYTSILNYPGIPASWTFSGMSRMRAPY